MTAPTTALLDDSHRLAAVAELLGQGPVVDVGAGPCLLEATVSAVYIPIDVEASRLASGPRRVVADVLHLPFRDGAAGTITCVSTMQYVPNVEAGMIELRRVAKPNATVIVVVPNLAYVKNVLTLVRGRLPWSSSLDDWRGGTLRYFTSVDVRPMFERVGFRVLDVRCTGRFRRLRSLMPSRLGAELVFVMEPGSP